MFACLLDADYGRSFSDVVQGLEHVLENLGSDQVANPSNFKYRVALEKQVGKHSILFPHFGGLLCKRSYL